MNKLLPIVTFLSFFFFISTAHAQLNPNKLTHFDELNGTQIYDILSDRMGNIWIATQSGLVKFDGYEYTRYHPDLNDPTTMGELLTYSLLEDRNGFLWIGCMNGIYRYNPNTKLFKRYLFEHLVGFQDYAQAGISRIIEDNDGRIYFGVDSNIQTGTEALIYYDEADDQMKTFEYPDTLNLLNVYGLASDPSGNIWILSYGGFFKIDTEWNLHQIQQDEFNLANEEYLSGIQSDSSGTIWISTTHSRLHKYDPSTAKPETWTMQHLFEDGIYEIYTRDIEIDKNQNLWISSNRGLISFNTNNSSFEIFEDNNDVLPRAYIEALDFDSFGNLWIGTETNGVLKYSDKTILGSFAYNPKDETSITSGWINRIFESNDGAVWVVSSDGSTNEGLNLLDTDAKTITPMPYSKLTPGLRWLKVINEIYPGKILVDSDRGYKMYDLYMKTVKDTVFEFLPENIYIFDALWDSRKTLWYCTADGLFADDRESDTYRHFDLTSFGDTVSAANEVTHVYEGPNHGLWVLSNLGLFLYDYGSGDLTRHAYNPEKGDVLGSQDINSIYEDKDGIVWVGTWQGGLCRYDPASGKVKTYSINDGLPSTSIQGILADEKNNALWLSTFAGISRFNIEEELFTNYSLRDGIQGLLYADGACLKTSGNFFIFGGNNGITWFNPDEIAKSSLPPKVYITEFNVADESMDLYADSQDLKSTKKLAKLSHHQNNISIDYTGIQYDNPSRNTFAYKLENYDDSWREVGSLRSAFYYNLPPGKFTFRVKAANSNGVWNEQGASISFEIAPPWWLTWWAYVIYGILFVALIFAFDRIQRQRLIEKARKEAKEKELEQAREIEKAYTKLKDTQTQLIHSEKMASLGELTAGIAHEIQNPLNFVNNFSEVNSELIDELEEEAEKGNLAEVKAIAKDIKENEQKINHHGKRADAIVKGMLHHSRSGTGQKEPTDINALADEYMRLSYHGLRAKDKNFSADFKTELDDSLPKINAIPQDIGRVLLNLINNAFYAVHQKTLTGLKDQDNFKPLVTLTTNNLGDSTEILVKDNGNGIPDEIKDKIFQPFFTTKPTGEGTGLGLSMSYDIITKGHGGELKVESKEGEGSQFIIHIPIIKK
jgi:signal transduction histidine kinase/ligand-binding sensor domain-containing protein